MTTYRLVVSVLAMALAGCAPAREPKANQDSSPPAEAVRPSVVDRHDLQATEAFDWNARIGVAGFDTSGHLCLAISSDSLSVGTPATLVWPARPQSVSHMTVGAPHRAPWVIGNMPVEGRAYDLQEVSGERQGEGMAIAIVGDMPAPRIEDDLVRIDLDGDGAAETFRLCASNEGLHLTVWSGEPLTGPQDWHHYVYLGMDLEADCTEKDGEAAKE